MLNDEICKLRDRLNESITIGEDYNIIYKLSDADISIIESL